MMLIDLLLASLMVVLTVIIHFSGLLLLMRLLSRHGHELKAHESVLGQFGLLIVVVLGIFALHSIEIWLYALVYYLLGAITEFETALYFSTVTFTTVGYGDIVLAPEWRIFGAIEAANGWILFGWSTAFLIGLTGKLRSLEHDWLERSNRAAD